MGRTYSRPPPPVLSWSILSPHTKDDQIKWLTSNPERREGKERGERAEERKRQQGPGTSRGAGRMSWRRHGSGRAVSVHSMHSLQKYRQGSRAQLSKLDKADRLLKSSLSPHLFIRFGVWCAEWISEVNKFPKLLKLIFVAIFTACRRNFIREDLNGIVRVVTIKEYLIS